MAELLQHRRPKLEPSLVYCQRLLCIGPVVNGYLDIWSGESRAATCDVGTISLLCDVVYRNWYAFTILGMWTAWLERTLGLVINIK